jgi:hypothetical protein
MAKKDADSMSNAKVYDIHKAEWVDADADEHAVKVHMAQIKGEALPEPEGGVVVGVPPVVTAGAPANIGAAAGGAAGGNAGRITGNAASSEGGPRD